MDKYFEIVLKLINVLDQIKYKKKSFDIKLCRINRGFDLKQKYKYTPLIIYDVYLFIFV